MLGVCFSWGRTPERCSATIEVITMNTVSTNTVNPKVSHVAPLEPYLLLVIFETGERRCFDLAPYLQL